MAELVDKMCNQQRERIAELERQLAEEKKDFDALDDQYHRLGEKYEALQWQPITPDNLPKVGDEVGGQDKMSVFMDRSFRNLLRTVSAYTQSNIAEEWHRLGYHYFRAINLPSQHQLLGAATVEVDRLKSPAREESKSPICRCKCHKSYTFRRDCCDRADAARRGDQA